MLIFCKLDTSRLSSILKFRKVEHSLKWGTERSDIKLITLEFSFCLERILHIYFQLATMLRGLSKICVGSSKIALPLEGPTCNIDIFEESEQHRFQVEHKPICLHIVPFLQNLVITIAFLTRINITSQALEKLQYGFLKWKNWPKSVSEWKQFCNTRKVKWLRKLNTRSVVALDKW